jgi:drug/metabolite transporter (DMT)-like permease
MIFLKESLNFKMILGFALIAAGIALTQFENV